MKRHGDLPQSRDARRLQLKRQIIFSLFAALILLLSFTPVGFIHLGFIKATSVHIPVILGGLLLGPFYGAGLGLIFGLCSVLNNSLNPSALSFCFSPLIPVFGSDRGSLLALVIALGPRILCGFAPAWIWAKAQLLLKRKTTQTRSVLSNSLAGGILGALGSMLNTLPVMALIYFFFAPALAQLKGLSGDAVLGFVLGVISANGIPEMLVAAVFCAAALPVLTPLLGIRPARTDAASKLPG